MSAMFPRFLAVPAALVFSLLCVPSPAPAQDDVETGELRLLATINVRNSDLLITGGKAFLQAVSMSDSFDSFTSQVKALRYSSNSRGIDAKRPLRVFLLAGESPTNGLVRVSFIPVADKGKAFLTQLVNDFEIVQNDGAITSAEMPFDKAFPERVLFAPTTSGVIASDDFAGIRWVVEHLRAHNLPDVGGASIDSPFRVTIKPDTLSDCIGSVTNSAIFTSGKGHVTASALLGNLAHIASVSKDLNAINAAVSPTASGIEASLEIVAKPGTRLGAALGTITPPTSVADHTLPGNSYLLRCDTIPAFLNAAPKEMLEWSGLLADSWSIFGCSVGPAKYHWFPELLQYFSGDRLAALTMPPGIDGVANLQMYSLRNSAKAAEKLAELVDSLRSSPDFKGNVSEDIDLGGARMHRFTPEPTFTRESNASVATSFDLDAALSSIMRQTTYEAVVTNDKLIVVYGPEGSLAALLPALLDKHDQGETFRRAKRLMNNVNPNARLSGASVYSFANLIRAIAQLSPDIDGSLQISLMPDTGDGMATLMAPSRNALRWDFRLATPEASLLRRIFSAHYSILQEIIVQLTLEPLRQRHKAGQEQRDDVIPIRPVSD